MVDESGSRSGDVPSGGGGDRAPGASTTCPGCGVAVAPGYPKCPKCHTRLPFVPSPLQRVGSKASGGTAVDSGSGAGMWAVVAAIVVIAGAVAFMVMRSRGGDAAATAEADAGGEAGETVAAPADEDVEGSPSAADFDEEAPDDAVDTAVLDGFSAKLAEERLWSSVEPDAADETIVHVVSSHCEDGNLRRAVASFADDLKDGGFVRVQCFTQHGALSFEREL